MITRNRRIQFLLFAGDVVSFVLSLYLTLWIRYDTIPTLETLVPYVVPFTVLFILWTIVFYISGLYSKRVMLFPSRLPDLLFKTQLANILASALFFFLIPSFGISPKTILVLYLIVSFALILFWRLVLYPYLSIHKKRERAVLLARGNDADDLFTEVNGNARYGIEFCSRKKENTDATFIVVDAYSAPTLLKDSSIHSDVQIISFEDLYEEIFDRVPLSTLSHTWFREYSTLGNQFWYRFSKRTMDIVIGIFMAIVTIITLPFIWIALKIEGEGPIFIIQNRFGENGSRVRVYKFRSMLRVDDGVWDGENENRVTRVGSFLRKTSLDEFPQFINLLKGEISAIGPRNDIEDLGTRLAKAIPYYMFRYSVKPGITGWAQINQQYEQGNISPQSVEETKTRLAYDFYYLKHRSIGLDGIIALKTLKKMLFRVSSR